MAVSQALRQRVIKRAKGLCEYCQTSQETVISMELDHIQPKSRGGTDNFENLCWSCVPCNKSKKAAQTARDPVTNQMIPLFNPRIQNWDEHFKWSEDSTELIGRTDVGRATIQRLGINHSDRVKARARWVRAGWHPPK